MENAKVIRQGDLLFVPLEKPPAWARLECRKPEPGGVIAHGEASGHHHRVAMVEDAEVFDLGFENVFVRVGPNGVSIIHEEHGPVKLAPNTVYRVHRAREFDYLANLARTVAD
jgi:hypothetical protein